MLRTISNPVAPGFCLMMSTPDVREIVAGALAEQQLLFERRGQLLAILETRDASRIVAVLRQGLAGVGPNDVMVVSPGATGFRELRSLDEWWRITETGWFDQAVLDSSFTTWFQPIVDTSIDGILGYECLARADRHSGGEIFEAAKLRGEERSMDGHLRRIAVRSAAEFGGTGLFFINFLPRFVYEPETCLADTFAAVRMVNDSASHFIFEAVHAAEVKPRHLGAIAASVRERGCGFSLDDLNICNGGLQLIYDLRPEYVKLAGELMLDIEAPACATAIRRIVEAAEQTGTTVVAKNVEDVVMMENLWLLGVQVMQGNYFGCPAPAPALAKFDVINLTNALERPYTPRYELN
jgi:EAL domain-containing protein (putative c-di-GMP-specific phosphodiesterase class I)